MRTAADPALGKPRRWAAFSVLSLALVVISMDMTILNVALPHIAADLHTTSAQQLWIVDVYSLVLAGLLVPLSAVADRFGRKRILLTGFALFAAASLLVFFAQNAPTVIAIRAFLGVGGAMIMPTTLSLIRVMFTDPQERATALGIWAAVSSTGVALGPILGGALLERATWHAAFLVNVPFMALALLAGTVLLPESRATVPPRWDTLGAAGAITGMVAVIWSIKHLASHGPANVPSWAALAAGAVTLGWFVLRCLRQDNPMLDLRLFRSRTFTAGIVAATTFMFALSALLLLAAQWLQIVQGASPFEAGAAMLPVVLTVAVASPLAPLLASRVGARCVLGGGLALAGVGYLTIFLAPSPLRYSWMAVAIVLLGTGGSALSVGSTLIMSSAPRDKAGNAAALEETGYELGSVLGVAILGSIASATYRADVSSRAAGLGLRPDHVSAASESLAGAANVAHTTGSTELMALAGEAFTSAMGDTGAVGFITMTVIAVAVAICIPRRFNFTQAEH